MDENTNSLKFGEAVIIITITCIFSAFAGFSLARIKYTGMEKLSNTEEESDAVVNFVKQYNYIKDNYYDKSKINDDDMMKIALESVLSKLGIDDNYSVYMDEDKYNQMNLNLEGSYEGLGVSIYKDPETKKIIIINITKGSPAEKAKLEVGDIIISIDDKNLEDLTTQEFSEYVLKNKKKNFTLKIERNSEEQVIEIDKGNVELESVYSKIINKNDNKIGYIGMTIFASNTYNQFKTELEKLENENIEALIIDLRGNTGGHLQGVTDIISLFVSKDKVIYQLEKDNKREEYYSNGNKDKAYPIIFIGNGATASASEVFIISLKENLDATLVGTKTYGKGTVQELINMKNGDQYKFTTKRWLSPKGNWINDTKGIEPDIVEELSDSYYENPSDESDNQLQRAVNEAVILIKEKE